MRFLAVGHVNILTKKQKQICQIVPQSRAPSGLAVVLGPQEQKTDMACSSRSCPSTPFLNEFDGVYIESVTTYGAT